MKKKIFTRPLSITLEKGIYERIKQLTDLSEVSISEWVRGAIDMRMFSDMREMSQSEDDDLLKDNGTT